MKFIVFVSVAMLRYLCSSYPEHVSDHWYPADLKLRARVDEYMQWQHANTRFYCALFTNHKVNSVNYLFTVLVLFTVCTVFCTVFFKLNSVKQVYMVLGISRKKE